MHDHHNTPAPRQTRAQAEQAALARLVERFGSQADQLDPHLADEHEAVIALQFAQTTGKLLTRPEPAPPVEVEDLVAALRLIPNILEAVRAMQYRLIDDARALGLTWRQIADELQLDSPQAAAQRYQRLGGQPEVA